MIFCCIMKIYYDSICFFFKYLFSTTSKRLGALKNAYSVKEVRYNRQKNNDIAATIKKEIGKNGDTQNE